MPFEQPYIKRIAIIGSGVSGLAAAYQLSRENDVTVFEADNRIGGHARTIMAGKDRATPVDTGFIVFNYETYPHLTKMFEALNVPVKQSNMSFGVSINNGAMEYSGESFSGLLAQRTNIVNPQFWRMVYDIFRFNSKALSVVKDENMTLSELIYEMKLSKAFMDYYLLPFSSAIWSSTPQQMAEYPAKSLLQFFENHALLTSFKRHQWYTVAGGSIEYLHRISQAINKKGGQIRLSTPVRQVLRGPIGVKIICDGYSDHFDEVIFACHSDQALALLKTPTTQESEILGDIHYQDNIAILHKDTGQMPNCRAAWASWVYRDNGAQSQNNTGVTYWMNNLQGLDPADPLFVSLNPSKQIRDELIYDQTIFAHPVFNKSALAAQRKLPQIQGLNNTWFCGAWTRHGFHEDGYASGVLVAQKMQNQQTTTS